MPKPDIFHWIETSKFLQQDFEGDSVGIDMKVDLSQQIE
jgi:hypothetical protein